MIQTDRPTDPPHHHHHHRMHTTKTPSTSPNFSKTELHCFGRGAFRLTKKVMALIFSKTHSRTITKLKGLLKILSVKSEKNREIKGQSWKGKNWRNHVKWPKNCQIRSRSYEACAIVLSLVVCMRQSLENCRNSPHRGHASQNTSCKESTLKTKTNATAVLQNHPHLQWVSKRSWHERKAIWNTKSTHKHTNRPW